MANTKNMIDEEPPNLTVVDRFWGGNNKARFTQFENELPEDLDAMFMKEFFRGISIYHKKRIWNRCEASGATAVDVAMITCMDADNMRRTLKDGTPSWECLWAATEWSHLGPTCFQFSPYEFCVLIGNMSVVEWLRHRAKTYAEPALDAARTPISRLSIPHAALLHAVQCDEHCLNRFLYYAVLFRDGFATAADDKQLHDFVTSIYQQASALIRSDKEASLILDEWCPSRAGVVLAIRHIAQAWNPYQTYWYLVKDEARFY